MGIAKRIFLKFMSIMVSTLVMTHELPSRAGRNDPAAPVLARPVFSQGKNKIPFLQNQVINKSASVIVGLIRLITLVFKTKILNL